MYNFVSEKIKRHTCMARNEYKSEDISVMY